MNPTIRVLSREDAAAAGFATFNRCDHVCIDLPPGMTSISLRSADGKLVSMCLLPSGSDEARPSVWTSASRTFLCRRSKRRTATAPS